MFVARNPFAMIEPFAMIDPFAMIVPFVKKGLFVARNPFVMIEPFVMIAPFAMIVSFVKRGLFVEWKLLPLTKVVEVSFIFQLLLFDQISFRFWNFKYRYYSVSGARLLRKEKQIYRQLET